MNLTCALVTSGARNCESFNNSQISALVPSPLGNLAAASRTDEERVKAKDVLLVLFAHTYSNGIPKAWQWSLSNTEALTQRKNGDIWWTVWAEQRVLPGFVERHLLIKHPLDRPHHGFKAMHPEGEGFMWLVVSLLLLINKDRSLF